MHSFIFKSQNPNILNMTSPVKTNKYDYVMLIDDVELDNFINERLIRSYNFSKYVYVSTSASSALEFLHNMVVPAKDYPQLYPGVIFVDINMPIMDGFQFINAFREIFQTMENPPKLVILTSSVAELDREKTLNISNDIIFLNKPLSKEMLELL